MHVQVGTLSDQRERAAELATGDAGSSTGRSPPNQEKVVWVRSPGAALRRPHVVVDAKFVPRDVDPSSQDGRALGALVSYRYFAALPPRARPTRTSSGF